MSQQFQFKGASAKTAQAKIRWPLRAQALVIAANMNDGHSGADAFRAGIEAYNVDADQPMDIDALPASYSNKNASSVLYGVKERFLKKVNNEKAKGHDEARELALELGLIEEVDE